MNRPIPAKRLTPRQSEVCEWLCAGKRSSEIAMILGISPETVRDHIKAAYQRYGVTRECQLAFKLGQESRA